MTTLEWTVESMDLIFCPESLLDRAVSLGTTHHEGRVTHVHGWHLGRTAIVSYLQLGKHSGRAASLSGSDCITDCLVENTLEVPAGVATINLATPPHHVL